jgi:hypothetical protein
MCIIEVFNVGEVIGFLFDQTCSRTFIILNTHNNVQPFPCKYIGLPYIPLTTMQGSRIHHKLRQQHLETVTSLVRASRNFFLEGATAEIWSEFSFGRFLCDIQHECPFLFSYCFVLLWTL